MSSRSLNKVLLIGNLTRDPELRYTPQGTAVCTMSLATNRSWTSQDSGERNEQTEYHRIVAWSKLAEICGQLLKKGRKVFVEGRLQTRDWTTKDGQKRQTTEIVIDNMIMLDGPRGSGDEMPMVSKGKKPEKSENVDEEPIPTQDVESEDVSDDIPF